MTTIPQTARHPAEAAVLLVLLPLVVSAAERQHRQNDMAKLDALQQQLGAAIRVLRVDEASHPVVVRSFDGAGLPAFVLIRRGVELWRQPGLPAGEATARLLLAKLEPVDVAAQKRMKRGVR